MHEAQHPDRDAQFRYLNSRAQECLAAGEPVISVDTKKKELDITICHYPPGTSKWNKIAHKLFSRVTGNRRGRPLDTYQTVVSLIANTTTQPGSP